MRQPKPFFRKFTKTWYVTIHGQQHNLGANKDDAFQLYHELMAKRGQATASFKVIDELFDAYLEWLHKNRSQGTYDKAVHYLSNFAKFAGSRTQLAHIDGTKLILWIESKKWGDSTAHGAISDVQRAFNWAVRRGHLLHSPVRRVEGKPAKKRRETVLSPEDWVTLRAFVPDQQFGDFLDFLWYSGCRPLEARRLCASHVDLKHSVAVFPPSESKGERNERVIFLTSETSAICKRLIGQHPTGPLFRNTIGGPWKKDSINCRFQRLKKKLGKDVCAYSIRHSFATEGLKQGMDSLTLAQIMGHSDTTMLSKYYSHLARNPAYLRDQAKRVRA